MSRGPDAATLLERALIASARFPLTVVDTVSTRWASATFVGARHALTLAGDWSECADRWLVNLPEAELPIPRHLVAEVVVKRRLHDSTRFSATVEALTVEER